MNKEQASIVGKLLSSLRMQALSPERRRQIGRNAIRIRWERERARRAEAAE